MICAAPVRAQTLLVEQVKVANDSGLGFTFPTVTLSTGVIVPLGKHLELDPTVAYLRAHKAISGDGSELLLSAEGVWWPNSWLGVSSGLRYGRLRTSQEKKDAWMPSAGVVFRARPLEIPSRLWLDYLIPAGGIAADGTESNRLQGLEFTWDARMSQVFHLTIGTSVVHGLNQGAVYCYPVCKRTGYTTGNVTIGFEFFFRSRKDSEDQVW